MADAAQGAIRGLATIALLKVNYDTGTDYIGMFEPFLVDTLAHSEVDGATTEAIRDALAGRHSLVLPLTALTTLLGRQTRADVLKREGGRYFRGKAPIPYGDLVETRRTVEARQERLASHFINSSLPGASDLTAEQALTRILAFLERYHVAVALGRTGVLLPDVSVEAFRGGDEDRDLRVTAAFLQRVIEDGGTFAEILQELLEGFVLQNTLLLKDISAAKRQFDKLHVFCDSGLLFSVLGLRGAAQEIATKELLKLLSDTGAILDVFEPTLEEMRRVLRVHEDKLATEHGRQALYMETDLTRHIVESHMSPSDIAQEIALLPSRVRRLGVTVRATPTRLPQYTFDEWKLSGGLAERPGGENVPRVTHDVDCVAGVLQYRRGATSDSIDRAKAIFVTTSALTARNVTTWYEAEGGQGVPPIIHYLLLSNFAWLKKPASASRLKLHELTALCSAALRPTRETWNAFLAHLQTLEESGDLSSDEATAIVAGALTERILSEEQLADDVDSSTLAEVVRRVREADQLGAAERIASAEEDANRERERSRLLAENVRRRARLLATMATWMMTVGLSGVLLGGLIVSIVDLARGHAPSVTASVLAAVFVLATALALANGFQLKAWHVRVRERFGTMFERWFTGGDST